MIFTLPDKHPLEREQRLFCLDALSRARHETGRMDTEAVKHENILIVSEVHQTMFVPVSSLRWSDKDFTVEITSVKLLVQI